MFFLLLLVWENDPIGSIHSRSKPSDAIETFDRFLHLCKLKEPLSFSLQLPKTANVYRHNFSKNTNNCIDSASSRHPRIELY